jgi:hypothetical protein
MAEEQPRRGWRTRSKKAAIDLAVIFFSFLFAALLAEGAVRLVAPQQLIVGRPDIWAPDDSLGYIPRTNVDAEVNTGERTVRYITDDKGFRARAAGPRRRGDVNVLLIGDSFMQAFQVGYDSTLGAIIERRLTDSLGRSVAVWNAGASGWDPDQYLIRIRQLLALDAYDALIVAVYVDNDIIPNRRERIAAQTPTEKHEFSFPRRLSRDAIVNSILYPLNDALESHSHLFQLIKNGSQTILLRLGLAAVDFPVVVQKREAAAARWNVTASICADIAAVGARYNVPVLFGVIPAPYQVDSAAFDYYVRGFKIEKSEVDIDQPQRLLVSALRARGLNVVDALPAFRAAQRPDHQLFGSRDRHFTPAGHQLMSNQLMAPLAGLILSRTIQPSGTATQPQSGGKAPRVRR